MSPYGKPSTGVSFYTPSTLTDEVLSASHRYDKTSPDSIIPSITSIMMAVI